ncbi:MAG: transposase [Vicingaceae bacterium]
MANTYTQLYFHTIFAVKGRSNLISKNWKINLYKYISGIVINKGQKLMSINGVQNHLHILLGTQADCKLSDLIRDIKANSSKWINENRLVAGKFEWQRGFGAFSVSQSDVKRVIEYINNQEEHHKVKSFKKEYLELLSAHEIDYKTEYTFEDH